MGSSLRASAGGPRDWKRRQELQATGWQPYSVVFENPDGSKRYVSYGRLDPIAIPLGIVADLQDAVLALGDEDADGQFLDRLGGAGLALGTALINQFTSKSYLTGLSQFLGAVQEPDTRLEPTLGRMTSNFVPFASMLRQTDSEGRRAKIAQRFRGHGRAVEAGSIPVLRAIRAAPLG